MVRQSLARQCGSPSGVRYGHDHRPKRVRVTCAAAPWPTRGTLHLCMSPLIATMSGDVAEWLKAALC
jgi:hypothetical protein